MTELKPCPFCGGYAELREVYEGRTETYAIHCCCCNIHVTKFVWCARDKEDVIEEWNRRANE